MESFDLLVVGGGINGSAIARDAAIRGAKVLLVEKDDLAQHTSSASSKLIHGGLRYLEYYEFRLVREALKEREILLRTAPHIVRPLSFVLPHGAGMRPWWMVRTGLKLYDLLAWGGSLPRSRAVRHGEQMLRAPLLPETNRRLALYWDAWVDDARLVALNALDAAERGAEIATRTELLSAHREGELWKVSLSGARQVTAGTIVNAAGPWVAEALQRLSESSVGRVRLIKGSHIVVPRLSDGDHAYILQQPDGRVVFALPYEGRFTLIGTTDIPVDAPQDAVISPDEIDYLCAAANRYFQRQIAPTDVVWSYSGVRSLFDDGAADAKAVTRDYRLELDTDPGAKLLSVFGGKITTARALAEEALDLLGVKGRKSTSWSALPGGDIYDDFNSWLGTLSWLPQPLLARLARAYGTRMRVLLGDATQLKHLGRPFGAGLYEAEINYLREHEFARTADDILWRRTKLGLHMNAAERTKVAAFVTSAAPERLRTYGVDRPMTLSAKEAAAQAGEGKTVIGWKLDPGQRKELLQQFPPKFVQVIADHVTLASRARRDAGLPCETEGTIVGRIDDGKGVEALVVSIGGTTDRPDGSIYHITWSLGEGRRAKESNDVIRALGWKAIDLPMPVRLRPERF